MLRVVVKASHHPCFCLEQGLRGSQVSDGIILGQVLHVTVREILTQRRASIDNPRHVFGLIQELLHRRDFDDVVLIKLVEASLKDLHLEPKQQEL